MADTPEPAAVRCAPGARLSFSWGNGSQLRLVEQGVPDPTVSKVTWGAVSAYHRTLAYEVAPALSELQRSASHGGASTSGRREEDIVGVSRYSARVKTALLGKRDEETGQVAFEYAAWQLLELFCLHVPRSDGVITEDIVYWLSHNMESLYEGFVAQTPTLQSQVHDLLSRPSADSSSDFWPTVRRLVALGQITEAQVLLEAHDVKRHTSAALGTGASAGIRAQMELLDNLFMTLQAMPHYRRASGEGGSGRSFDNVAEFTQVRREWLASCSSVPQRLFDECKKHSPATAAGVHSVLALLVNQGPHALARHTKNWMEFLAAQLVHVRPTLSASQLSSLLPMCEDVQPSPQNWALQTLLSLVQALADMEVQEVVEVLVTCQLCSPWFLAHMFPLLRAYPRNSARLDLTLIMSGGTQEELFRMMFVETLMAQPRAWKLTLSYLAWCPTQGAEAAEKLLRSLPVGNSGDQSMLHQALRLCEIHGLTATATSLLRTAGTNELYAGRLGTAVQYLLAARDEARLAVALQPQLEAAQEALLANVGRYSLHAEWSAGAAELHALLQQPSWGASATSGAGIRQPAAVAVLSNLLELQAATAKAQKLLEAEVPLDEPDLLAAYSSARSALVALASRSHELPRRLVGALLFNALPYLEATHTPFSPSDVHTLLGCLKRFVSSGGAEDGEEEGSQVLHPRQLQDVRLGLARGMMRARVSAA